MGSLLLAAESIYALPWYLRRDFPNPIMETFGLTNTQLGVLSSVLGVMALISYAPGGWLADRLPARRLLLISLATTGAGGFYMATIPAYPLLVLLYGAWGITSILLFWGALVKATRAWGGHDQQGRAFGILEGGRGVVSGLLGLGGVTVFSFYRDTSAGLHSVIYVYAAASFVAAAAVWLMVPGDEQAGPRALHEPARVRKGQRQIGAVVRMPQVWLIACIVFTGYTCYWGTFDFATLAVDGYGQEDVFGGRVSAMVQFGRPVAAVGAGLLADRIGAGRTAMMAFAVLVASLALFALVPGSPGLVWLLWLNATTIAVMTFALRGIFYALLEEGRVPLALTGTAAGVVSVVGYSGDAFVPLLQGWLLDSFPGPAGHHYFFGVLAVSATVGLLTTVTFRRYTSTGSLPTPG